MRRSLKLLLFTKEKYHILYIMNFVTDKIDNYVPIKFANGKYIISWGLEKNKDGSYSWKYFFATKKPTPAEIKNILDAYINDNTKNSIINNFYWNGMHVYLSIENQIDYKLLFDITTLCGGENLPEKIKFNINGETIYYEFETLDEFTSFMIAMNKHIRTCLAKGNELKDSIDYTQYE